MGGSFFPQKFWWFCCAHGKCGRLEQIKVEFLQVHMIGREWGKVAESIHKEIFIKIKYRS